MTRARAERATAEASVPAPMVRVTIPEDWQYGIPPGRLIEKVRLKAVDKNGRPVAFYQTPRGGAPVNDEIKLRFAHHPLPELYARPPFKLRLEYESGEIVKFGVQTWEWSPIEARL